MTPWVACQITWEQSYNAICPWLIWEIAVFWVVEGWKFFLTFWMLSTWNSIYLGPKNSKFEEFSKNFRISSISTYLENAQFLEKSTYLLRGRIPKFFMKFQKAECSKNSKNRELFNDYSTARIGNLAGALALGENPKNPINPVINGRWEGEIFSSFWSAQHMKFHIYRA